MPGEYQVTETDPGSSWTVTGGDGATATVDPGQKTTADGITNTRNILGKYHFDGTGYAGKITAADRATMLQLALVLDAYNNNGGV